MARGRESQPSNGLKSLLARYKKGFEGSGRYPYLPRSCGTTTPRRANARDSCPNSSPPIRPVESTHWVARTIIYVPSGVSRRAGNLTSNLGRNWRCRDPIRTARKCKHHNCNEAATDGSFVIAQTNGQERRDTRQDCRQKNGAVGADKRGCKQQGRQN